MHSPPGEGSPERKFTVTLPPEKPDAAPSPVSLEGPDIAKSRSVGSWLLKLIAARELVKVERFDPKKLEKTDRGSLTKLRSDREVESKDLEEDLVSDDKDLLDDEIIRAVMASIGDSDKDSNTAIWIIAGLVATSMAVGGLVLNKLHLIPDLPNISAPKTTAPPTSIMPSTQKVRDPSTPAALDPLAGGCIPVGASSEVCSTKVARRFEFMSSKGDVGVALGIDVFVNNRITHVPVPSSVLSNPDAVKTLCDDKAVKNMYLNPELKKVEGSPKYGALTMSGVTPAAKAVICGPEELNG